MTVNPHLDWLPDGVLGFSSVKVPRSLFQKENPARHPCPNVGGAGDCPSSASGELSPTASAAQLPSYPLRVLAGAETAHAHRAPRRPAWGAEAPPGCLLGLQGGRSPSPENPSDADESQVPLESAVWWSPGFSKIQVSQLSFFYFLFFFFKDLFVHERVRGRDTGRRRTGSLRGAPLRYWIPGPRDHDLSQRQTLNH